MSTPTRLPWRRLPPRERPRVAKAKLAAYGIEAALDDQIEGGTVVVDGEPGVIVEVRAADAEDARRILDEGAAIGDTTDE